MVVWFQFDHKLWMSWQLLITIYTYTNVVRTESSVQHRNQSYHNILRFFHTHTHWPSHWATDIYSCPLLHIWNVSHGFSPNQWIDLFIALIRKSIENDGNEWALAICCKYCVIRWNLSHDNYNYDVLISLFINHYQW